MLYNKSKSRKLNDKKVLHKVRKRWIVVSSALLMALGGAAVATHAPSVHANVNNPNTVKSNLNSNQERVSQLTDKRGNSLNNQDSNLRSGSLNSAEVTSQARQLHSQILQNKVMSSADLGVQKSTSSSVNSQNSESSSFNDQVSNNNKLAKTTVNNNHSKVRSLGSAKQGYGTISIEYVDIHDGNKEVNNGFGSINKPAGTPFTKSDQDSFTKVTPPGYIFNNVISAPTHFIANQNQEFKIAVVPRKFKQATSSKILLEYTDADNGDIIVGKVHEFSDAPGTPFHLFQWEANRPDGYMLDPNDNNSNTISYQSSDKGNPTDIRHFIPNNNPNIEQPSIKYVPGTQLVQIGVKKDPNNSTHPVPSSVMAHMTVQYMDSVNHAVKKTLSVSGPQGSAFNVNEYANPSYLPNGYNTPLIEPGAPGTYANGEVATILVTPDNVPDNTSHSNSDDHKKADQTMAMMPVVYYVRNNNNYQVIGSTLMAKGYAGSTFNVLPYITTDVPANYSWVGFHGSVPSTYNSNDSVGIVVAPKASNNQHPQQQIVMPVEYQYQGQTVPGGKEFATGAVNSRFDITPFENNVPQNYRFAGTNDQEPQYYKPNSVAIINVIPNNVANDVTMPISYVYNKQTVGTVQTKGHAGQSFDVTSYEQNVVAKGYHFDPQSDGVNAPNVYIAGYHVVIDVSPDVNPTPNHNKKSDAGMAQMPINYVYNNQQVGTSTAYGVIGQPLNPQQYEQTVPNGYKYVNGVVNAPQTYMNGKSITINVIPINSNNNANSQQTISYITVQWIDGQNGKVSDALTLPGNPGQSFPLTYYENSAPEGTHSTGQLIGYPVTKFTTSNQTVKIQVLPDQTPVNQYGTITVRCVDPNGNAVGHSDTTNHKAGTPFDLLSELQFDIPSNYHFVKFLNGEGVHQYNAAQQDVKIEVALNNVNPTSNSVNNNGNQQNSNASMNSANNQASSASTPQPINNNFNPVINNNVPNPNVVSNSSNSNTYVPNSNSQIPNNNNVSPASNSSMNTNSNVAKDPVSHRDAKGTHVNASQNSDSVTDHDSNDSDSSTFQNSSQPSRNNSYGYRDALGISSGHSNQTTANMNGNDFEGIDSSVPSAGNNESGVDANNNDRSRNGNSKLPQTDENNEDRELAEIGSVLTAISIGLSQLGYSMEKHHRHN